MNLDLSISSSTLTSCEKVVTLLQELGLRATVVETTSVIENHRRYDVEKGCLIKFNRFDKEALPGVWSTIKSEFDLTCAHVDVPGVYRGCIYSYLRPPACPDGEK